MEKHTADCRPNCYIAHSRIALEDRIIRWAIRYLKAHGWEVFAVNDGQDIIPVRGERQALEVTQSVDCSVIRVRNTAKNRRSYFDVIRGNGIDVVGHDWGQLIDDEMTVITDHVANWSE